MLWSSRHPCLSEYSGTTEGRKCRYPASTSLFPTITNGAKAHQFTLPENGRASKMNLFKYFRMQARERLTALEKAKDPETTYQQRYSKGQCIPRGGVLKLGPCVTRTFSPCSRCQRCSEHVRATYWSNAVRKSQYVSVEWPSTFPTFRLSKWFILGQTSSEGDARADNVGCLIYASLGCCGCIKLGTARALHGRAS